MPNYINYFIGRIFPGSYPKRSYTQQYQRHNNKYTMFDFAIDSSPSQQQSINQQKIQNEQCITLLQNINLHHEPNRQWIAKCYRKLTTLINDNSNIRFNLNQKSKDLPEKTTKYAYNMQPYQFDQGLETYSKVFCDSTAGRRKCQMPLVYRSGSGGWEPIKIENNVGYIKQNNRFNIKIQAEQHSTIVLTYENNHPLRVKPQLRQNFGQNGNTLIQITPPCILNIVVVKQQEYLFDIPHNFNSYNREPITRTKIIPFRLPSDYIRLEVKKTAQGEDNNNFKRRLGDEYMIRPEETFDHGLSNSQGSNWHPFVPIETESRSRD